MIQNIFHTSCPNKTEEKAPKFKWGGFSMAGIADYICDGCNMSIMIEDESDQEVLNRHVHEYILWEGGKPTKITQTWLDEDIKKIHEKRAIFDSTWEWKRTDEKP